MVNAGVEDTVVLSAFVFRLINLAFNLPCEAKG